jgi:acyl-CoA synthetase (AMP-forming)/AMP-acid ligase II
MLVGDDGICTPRPGVEIGVVDGEGRPLPPGETGEVRVRTEGMVTEYLGNPELTARNLGGGWFRTGDNGVLLPSGRLKLMGRASEVLNIGGVKIAPAAIEEVVECNATLDDMAVTTKIGEHGVEELCIAMVIKDRAQAVRYGAKIANALPKSLGRVHFKTVDSIPRTEETGKVRREALKRLFAPD